MRQTNPNRKNQSGQVIVESALCLLTFIALLVGTLDLGQMLFFHQALVERVRGAVRWASVHQWDGTGDQVTNMVLFGRPDDSSGGASGFLGLTRDNVGVNHFDGTAANPNDERITVTIRNYRYNFFSPWIAGSFTDANPISESAPVFYRP
jgi:hypothetical protein